MTQIKLEVIDEDEDEKLYDDPAWDDLAREFSWHDLKPARRGFCLPPFLAESQHKYPHNDVRDDPTFNTYYLVISRPLYAGGVDSMHFAMQGYDQKPPWKLKATWGECVSTWQMGCRLGQHEHELPDDSDLPPLPMSPRRAHSSQERSASLSSASDRRSAQPTSAATPSRTQASTPRGTTPSTPRASQAGSRAVRGTTPVLRPAPRVDRSNAPVTPSRPSHARSSRTPGPSNVRASCTPGPASPSPTKLLFASRGSTPLSGVLTQNPAKLEELLETTDEVFVSGGDTAAAVEEALKFFAQKLAVFVKSHPPSFQIRVAGCRVSSNLSVPRKKAANDPSAHKRGPTPWCVGNKAAFIRRRFPTWLALNRKQRGLYLDATLVAFVLAFGMFFDIKTDLDYLPDEPEAGKTTIDFDDYDDALRERAEQYMKGLRIKISAFLREERDRLSDAAKNVDINTLWNEHIQAQAQKRPAGTLRLTHYYSVYHYDERIKSTFEAEWEDVWKVWREKCAAWDDEGIAIPEGEKEPHPVAVRTRVTQACWDREPQPFKVLVQEAYEKYKEEKQASRGIPKDIPDELRTPQDFQDALDAASVYLPPTVDAVGGKTGWVCTMLLAGPMPSEGGEIGMLSVHYGLTLDSQLKWYQADRIGFGKIERQYISFAKRCFFADARVVCHPQAVTDPHTFTDARPLARGTASPLLGTPPPSPMIPPTPYPTPYKDAPPRFRLSLESLTQPLSQITNGLDETTSLEEEHLPGPEQARALRRAALADDADIESGRSHEIWSYRSTDRWSLHVRDVFGAVQRGRDWGVAFATAVHAFFKLEDYMDYPIRHDGRRILGGSIRPAAYNTWSRRGCPYDLSMDLGDLSVFAQKYWLWWEALQPAGRLNSDNNLTTIEEFEGVVRGMDDWDGLEKCCGKDGIVQVLLFLLWWGDAVNSAGARPEEWLEWDTAVQDFRDVLSLMMGTPGFEKVARKRARARPAADKADNENGGDGINKSIKSSRKRKASNTDHDKPSKRAKATQRAVDKASSSNTKGSRKRKADAPTVTNKPTKRAKATPALTSTKTSTATKATTAPSTATTSATTAPSTATTSATTAPTTATAVEDEGRTLRNRKTLVKSFKVRQAMA
ncbi:hypothetical protein EV714DRAFT_288141 [Schizophyllum commune]